MWRVAVLKENGLFSFPSCSSLLLRQGLTETEWRWAHNAPTSAPLPTSVGRWFGADSESGANRTLISWLSSWEWELVTEMKRTGTGQTFKARSCRWPWSEKVKTDRIWGLEFHSKTWRKGILTTVFWKKKRCTASWRSLGLTQKSEVLSLLWWKSLALFPNNLSPHRSLRSLQCHLIHQGDKHACILIT